MYIKFKEIIRRQNKRRIVLSFACTILIYGIFNLQNDSTVDKKSLEVNKNIISKNPQKEIYTEKFTNQVNLNLNSPTHAHQIGTELIPQLSSPNNTINLLIQDTTNNCNVSRPNYPDLQFDNIYWQTLNTTNGTIKLFRAYYDDRYKSNIGPSIRIIAMINRLEIVNVTTYCQFWFNGMEKPIIKKNDYQVMWYRHWGWDKDYLAFLLTCPYNFKKYQQIPDGVSLVNKNCDQAGNYLKVLNYRPAKNVGKKPFVVCVKDVSFTDQKKALRLVEWIELVRILGVDKIYIYQVHVTGNIRKVFDYYERYGILQIIKIALPKGVTAGRWSNELVSINDCFYRNIYLYDYVAIFDTDEVILPQHTDDMSWIDMLKRIKNNHTKNTIYASYNFRNTYFLDILQHDWHSDLPHYLHMIQHINRPINHTKAGYAIKSFHDTELVKLVHNHYPMACFSGWCDNLDVYTDFGHLAHYRRECPQKWLPKNVCKYYENHTVEDKTVWKYKDELVKQSVKVINMLELLKKDKN